MAKERRLRGCGTDLEIAGLRLEREGTQHDREPDEESHGDLSSESTSLVPIDEFVQGNLSGLTFASATAELFTVMTSTSGLWDYTIGEQSGTSAKAYASSAVTFVPRVSGDSTLTVDVSGSGQYFFSDGLIRLTDLTANAVAFEYFWGYAFGRTLVDLPRDPTERLALGTYGTDQHWLSDHVYQLTMQVDTDASTDSQAMVIRTNGLVATPEPAALWTAFLGVAVLMRHRLKVRLAAAEQQ